MASKGVIAQRIKVMHAYVDGKEIQARNRNTARPEDWVDCTSPELEFHWDIVEYRIKPREPRRIFVPNEMLNNCNETSTYALPAYSSFSACIEHWPDRKPVELVEVLPEDDDAD